MLSNRGAPLRRKTALRQVSEKRAVAGVTSSFTNRGTGVARTGFDRVGGELHRTAPIRRTSTKTKMSKAMAEGFPVFVRGLIWQRAHGFCEACGLPLGEIWHAHHRQRRGVGDHRVCNGVALHPFCHILDDRAVHLQPTWSRHRGLIVPTRWNPEDEPLTLPNGRKVWLHPTEPVYLDARPADA